MVTDKQAFEMGEAAGRLFGAAIERSPANGIDAAITAAIDWAVSQYKTTYGIDPDASAQYEITAGLWSALQ
jgi:hypothetical protein